MRKRDQFDDYWADQAEQRDDDRDRSSYYASGAGVQPDDAAQFSADRLAHLRRINASKAADQAGDAA